MKHKKQETYKPSDEYKKRLVFVKYNLEKSIEEIDKLLKECDAGFIVVYSE